jgi:4-hydroxy-tetrahydrodipicolinate reductase
MRIALIGYGKMGKVIHSLLEKRAEDEVIIFEKERPSNWESQLSQCDVAIEFTRPDTAVLNLLDCFRLGVPVVTGSTGWLADFDTVKQACESRHGALFYASNFSLGVQLFNRVNRYAARLMASFPEYRLSIEEIHHIHKKDKPSGTAVTLAQVMLDERHDYQGFALEEEASSSQIPICAKREGDVFGIHTGVFTAITDEISIRHTAFGREGFAAGAITAARFLAGKKGIFTMNDLLPL